MFTEDLSVFFDTDEHAVSALLDGAPVTVIVVAGFDGGTVGGYGPAGSSPDVFLPASSVPAGSEGKTLVILDGPSAATYRVGTAKPDGTGLTTLTLLWQHN